MAFVGLGLPFREPGPRPSTPCPDFQCQPVKGTDGKETSQIWRQLPGFQMMTLRWLVFFLSLSFFFIFSFVFKIEHFGPDFLIQSERKLTVVTVLYHLPGIRNLSMSVLELPLCWCHTEDFM